MNRAIIMGRITKDLEIRQTPGGMAVLRFTVAVERRTKGEKQTDFISCVAFGQTAENIGKYFGKGRLILIEGNIKTGSYEKNGQTVYTTDIVVERFDFTGEKSTQDSAQSESRSQGYVDTTIAPNTPQSAGQTAYSGYDYEDVISDDGVPF